jgi:hypothetical protein
LLTNDSPIAASLRATGIDEADEEIRLGGRGARFVNRLFRLAA